MCVCVCERERERERDRKIEREKAVPYREGVCMSAADGCCERHGEGG